jgi:PAS domain S-box-containing protein
MTAPTILVIEDNPLTQRTLRVALESQRYSVLEAADARTALGLMTERLPDMVIQDLLLPDMDGIELTGRLRRLPRAVDVPILALTGFTNAMENARVAEAGFTACLEKPIDPERLFAAISAHLPRRSQPTRIGEGRRVLLVDDDPVLLKLARLHFGQLGYEVTVASYGTEALERARQLAPDAIVSDVLMPVMDGFQLCLAVRRDPALASVPVVLISTQYREEPDRRLASKVGASALLARTPDYESVARAVNQALTRTPPAADVDAWTRTPAHDEQVDALVRQVDRQLAVNAELAQRCSLQAAQLSVLGGIADALARKAEIGVVLRGVLAACLDAGGISRGVLYLRQPTGALCPSCAIGFADVTGAELDGFFGHRPLLERVLCTGIAAAFPVATDAQEVSRSFLVRAGVASARVVPLVHDGECIGALMLGSNATNLGDADSVAFSRAIAGQIAKSVALTRAFDELAASEARYRSLMEEASCAVFTVREGGEILDANRRAEQLLAAPRQQLTGRSWLDFLAAPDREYVATRLRQAMQASPSDGPTSPSEVTLEWRDGRSLTAEFSAAAVETNGQRLAIVIADDVTERNRLRQQAAVRDKLATVGTLAAGLAHEINNPLAYVLLNLGTLREQLEGGAGSADPAAVAAALEALELARSALSGAQRIRDIVKAMKGFARSDEGDLAEVNVNQLLQAAISMAAHEIKYRARLETAFQVDLPRLVANPGKLTQLFLNLVINAVQAIDEGDLDGNVLRVHTRRDGSRIRVEVTDSGKGIPRHVLPRIFDPFFTTKPIGVGTGLGLSICHEIVRNHGGEIQVDSEVGKGTTFTVLLPLQGEHPLPASTPAPTPTARRRARILLVDDERFLLRALQNMISQHHQVTPALGGRVALQALAAPVIPFDVIVTDLAMPEVSGIDLHRYVSEKLPGFQQRMVFITGGTASEQGRAFLTATRNRCLEKPFEAADLLRAIDAVMDS